MKYLFSTIAICLMYACSPSTSAKEKIIETNVIQSLAKYGVDQSPMDMIYLPIDYPKLKLQDEYKEQPICRIIYSRPQKNGRQIFGQVIPFDKPWRLGANESTEIEFFQNAFISGKPVEVGKYILYCIPTEKEWTIVLNKNIHSWGLKVDPAQDYLSVKIPIERLERVQEIFSMEFIESNSKYYLIIAWDDTIAYLPINI